MFVRQSVQYQLKNISKVIPLICFALLWCLTSSAQHAIRADRAAKHIGEKMTIVDSIYDVKAYNNAVDISLGRNGRLTPLKVTLKLSPGFRLDESDLKNLDGTLLEVNGKIILTGKQPTIYITRKDDLYFFSPAVNQKWQVLSQLPDKKTK